MRASLPLRSGLARALAVALAWGAAIAPHEARAASESECIHAAEAAQLDRQAGRLTSALDRLAICASEECPLVVRKDCVSWLGDVEQTIPSLVVRASDARGSDVVGVRVAIDGRVVRERLDGRAIAVDPGPHEVRFQARGTAPVVQRVLVSEGEKARELVAHFQVPLTVEGDLEQPPARTSNLQAIAGWSLVGLGAAGIVTFGVLELLAQSEYQSLRNGCGTTRSCTDPQTSPTQTKFDAAKVALVVGGVGIAIGVPLLVFRSGPDAPRAAITAVSDEHGAGVCVVGAF